MTEQPPQDETGAEDLSDVVSEPYPDTDKQDSDEPIDNDQTDDDQGGSDV